ncbi:MAG: hypothetical protein PVJ98_06985 [Akkermansiaceae bacterium]
MDRKAVSAVVVLLGQHSSQSSTDGNANTHSNRKIPKGNSQPGAKG